MTKVPLLLLVLLADSQGRASDDAAVIQRPAERYAAMAQKSPFALATVAAPAAVADASFAANWYVAGIGRVGDDDFVTIKSRDATVQFSLFGRETHAATGVTLASVDWSETIGKSSVVLSKGGEMAKLEFNEAELRNPPASSADGAPPPPDSPPDPNNPGMQNPAIPRAPSPNAMGASRQTQRNPVVVTPPRVGRPMPPAPGMPGEIRRRVRPIPIPNE